MGSGDNLALHMVVMVQCSHTFGHVMYSIIQ